MGQHRALRQPRRAAGVEDPREIALGKVGRGHRRARDERLVGDRVLGGILTSGVDQVTQRLATPAQLATDLEVGVVDDQGDAARVLDDERQLGGRQAKVEVVQDRA